MKSVTSRPSHCCEQMRQQAEFQCPDHPDPAGCVDALIGFAPRFDEYGIWVHDGPGGDATSWVTIRYCPFCGASLPRSRRDEWFETVESMALDPEPAPATMRTFGWWAGPS